MKASQLDKEDRGSYELLSTLYTSALFTFLQ